MDEQQWFDQIYHQYADFLFRIGRRLQNPGESEDALFDIIQEVFLVAWDKRAELMTHPNIGGWLVSAIKFRVRGARSKVQRRSAHHAYSLDEPETVPLADDSLSVEQDAVLSSHLDAIRELLGEENTELFLAYTLQGYSARELAEKTGLSESCVWMRIARIKKKLSAHPEIFYVFLILMTGIPTLTA